MDDGVRALSFGAFGTS